jgi:hypothetical protein
MDEYLIITDGAQSIKVNRKDAIRMELKLNVSPYKRSWIDIGDALFEYGSKNNGSVTLKVTEEQFVFLEEMHNMLDYYRETK